MADKPLFLGPTGGTQEREAVVVPNGVASAGRLVAFDANGRLAQEAMPTGVAPDINVYSTSEALAAGDLVNVNSTGSALRARKADASTAGKRAHGFTKATVASGGSVSLYAEGTNDQVTGLLAFGKSELFLSATTPGGVTGTPPTGSGQVVQFVGYAASDTAYNFQLSAAHERA